MEILVASACGSLVIIGVLIFMNFARLAASGIMAQAMVSDTAARTIAHMKDRIRLATSITVDATGNILTLGFDDNYNVDSDGDGNLYNDQDHYEVFQFTGTNGTNSATASSNSLIYTPKVGVSGSKVLVSSGIRNLPGYNIFTLANPGAVIIRFGVVDTYTRDRFQSIDIQATCLSMNRPASSSTIGVIP
jgi:hypothetical protein